jgi:predicted Fe-S protein YdhL (DUF1289 family)
MNSDRKDIQSPCVNVCQMNPFTGLCRGCFRTLDEIAGWLDFSVSEKLEMLKRLDERRPGPLPPTEMTLSSCHAWASDSPVIAKRFPEFYTGPKKTPG